MIAVVEQVVDLADGLGSGLVDRLAEVREQIAALEKEEEELREQIVSSGLSKIEGDRYCAVVSRSTVTRVDYKAICEKLKPSHQLMTAHTSVSDRVSVRVSKK